MSDPTAKRVRFVAAFTLQFGSRRFEVAQLQASLATGEQRAAWLRIIADLKQSTLNEERLFLNRL